jgi:hypothetical protein
LHEQISRGPTVRAFVGPWQVDDEGKTRPVASASLPVNADALLPTDDELIDYFCSFRTIRRRRPAEPVEPVRVPDADDVLWTEWSADLTE